MSDHIFGVHEKYYTSQRAIDLYPTSGSAADWYTTTDLTTVCVYNKLLNSAGFTQMMLMSIMMGTGQLVILLNYETLVNMVSCCHLIRYS